jgi:hypothetical protein
MKNITLILIFILANFTQNFAQFYNKGAQITVQSGIVLTVNGDFLNDINSNFKNDGKVIIKGNITNNQTMNNAFIGIWELNGTTNQSISGIYPLNVYDIKFDNPAGFLLSNGISINNQASFLNGLVANNDASVVVFKQNAVLSTSPTDASHVTGPVAKEGTSTFTFPVGDNAKYQPINAAFTENTSGFLAKYIAGDAGMSPFGTNGSETTALTAYNNSEYWDLQPFNEGNTTALITLFWDGYKDSSPNDVASRRVAHKIDNFWLNEGSSTNSSGNSMSGSVKSNLISSWSPITLGFVTATPLPLRLMSFSGKKVESGNQLNWLTSNEIGVSHFEIEKSENGKSFNKIGEVKANGGPAENVNYEYIDVSTLPSNQNSSIMAHGSSIYYRLKMIDLDGKYSYSKIISIKNEPNQIPNIKIYPNPAISELIIENLVESSVVITNLAGQTTLFNVLKKNDLQSIINVSALPKGMYFLKTGNEVKRFLKE